MVPGARSTSIVAPPIDRTCVTPADRSELPENGTVGTLPCSSPAKLQGSNSAKNAIKNSDHLAIAIHPRQPLSVSTRTFRAATRIVVSTKSLKSIAGSRRSKHLPSRAQVVSYSPFQQINRASSLQPSRVTPSLSDALHLRIEACMKPLTETQWQLEDSFVSSEDQTISSGIQNCRANLTVFQMLLDIVSFRSSQVIVEVTRDVLPDVFAIYNQENHPRFGLTCFSCGASVFYKIIWARCSLTFTDATETPRASADSFTLNSSTSRNRKISR
jgi:hypothetical protein